MPGLKVDREYSDLDGYEVVSYYSCDDELWVALIPAFTGCAVDGASREDAIAALAELKSEWIAAVQGRGKSVPLPQKTSRILA